MNHNLLIQHYKTLIYLIKLKNFLYLKKHFYKRKDKLDRIKIK
jgi:hypothetical protein